MLAHGGISVHDRVGDGRRVIWRHRGRAIDLRLVDVTADSGIDFTHENSPTTQKYLIETMGGGVAVLDYDSDGWLDLFFTNGAQLSAPMPPEAHTSKTDRFANRLYRNRHDGTFADVTRAANVGGDTRAANMAWV